MLVWFKLLWNNPFLRPVIVRFLVILAVVFLVGFSVGLVAGLLI